MKSIVSLCCVLTVAQASLVAFIPAVSHYHSQDQFGQYSYGYFGGPSSKQEIRTADGITQGGYSYVDANNLVQTVSYVSDPIHGFRVAATNLPQQAPHIVAPLIAPVAPVIPIFPEEPKPAVEEPKPTEEEAKPAPEEPKPTVDEPKPDEIKPVVEDTEEVKAAKIAHFKAYEEAKAAAEHSRRRRSIVSPYAFLYSPIISSQYQVQDNLGQYTYGYNDGLSAKAESRSAHGITTGGYSYLDAHGQIQAVNYIADALGFRVAASNLPEGPKSIDAPAPVLPIAPSETPEVAAARAAHLAAHEEAKKKADE